MIYTVAIHQIKPSSHDDYTQVFRQAFREANFTGVGTGKILRSIEDPTRVIVIVEWDSVEAHRANVGTPAHDRFLATLQAHWTAPHQGGHYTVEEL